MPARKGNRKGGFYIVTERVIGKCDFEIISVWAKGETLPRLNKEKSVRIIEDYETEWSVQIKWREKVRRQNIGRETKKFKMIINSSCRGSVQKAITFITREGRENGRWKRWTEQGREIKEEREREREGGWKSNFSGGNIDRIKWPS